MKVNYNYVRPYKAIDMKKRHTDGLRNEEDLKVEFVSHATILPVKKVEGDSLLFGRGGVVDEFGQYVELSSIPGRIEQKYDFGCSVPLSDSKVVYAGYLVNHWGHFLVEGISRLWYLFEDDATIDKYVFTVEDYRECCVSGNYREFFQLLNVWEKVEIINTPVTYREVVVPQRAYCRRSYYSDKYKKIFNAVSECAMKRVGEFQTYESIFLSRALFKKAKKYEIGTELLDDYFLKNGYKIIYPETVSLAEMIVLIRSAQRCACASGSIAHNMLFGLDRQQLTIVERVSVINPDQIDVDCIKDLHVTYIDAHYTIYPVPMGSGPCFFSFNKQFRSYCEKQQEVYPSQRFLTESYRRKGLRQYMRTYRKENGYMWGLEGEWQLMFSKAIYEGYLDSLSELRPYLDKTKPFLLEHFFSLGIWKVKVKKIIKHILLNKKR